MDLAEAHLAAAAALDGLVRGKVYNVGCGRDFTVLEVVAAVERAIGARLSTEHAPRRAGDPPVLVADASRIAAELDWRASRTELDDIVGSAWRGR